ncbi:hypothetical protein, partial [Saccharicrinis sp. FJH54]|uniref:hypothetical protein n=1 Tax=Saccharicrinis sp. FJH54 TaxID=3344665 RepID=UPI0035D4F579
MSKPKKPYKTFPLTPRTDGRWCKRIRGQVHYFTGTADEALAAYKAVADDLHAGRTPAAAAKGAVQLRDVLNVLLTHQRRRADAAEIAPHSFEEWRRNADLLASHFGPGRDPLSLTPEDFAQFKAAMIDRDWALRTVRTRINYTKAIFRFAYEEGLIEKPVRFGPRFKAPRMRSVRAETAAKGPRMLSPKEFRHMLEISHPQYRAM